MLPRPPITYAVSSASIGQLSMNGYGSLLVGEPLSKQPAFVVGPSPKPGPHTPRLPDSRIWYGCCSTVGSIEFVLIFSMCQPRTPSTSVLFSLIFDVHFAEKSVTSASYLTP